MIFERIEKATITPFELNKSDVFRFTLDQGQVWEMELIDVSADVLQRGFDRYNDPNHDRGDITVYGFTAQVKINGCEYTMSREVGSQASFYKPWVIDGVRIWFDAAACAFKHAGGFISEKDWRSCILCEPTRATRWAVQVEGRSICPEPLLDWYPCPEKHIDIRNCYTGEDCWMGPYNGGAAHCGLDINMPAGTVLTTPFALDDQYLYNSLAAGFKNNRWVGIRRWADGSTWEIVSNHLIDQLVPQCTPLAAGVPYATTAGTAVGARQHTHFLWRIRELGGTYLIDPWILMSEIWSHSEV